MQSEDRGDVRSKLETDGSKYYVASDPVLDIELVKPLAAKGDFLLTGFERVCEQWSDPCVAADKRTKRGSGPIISGYLLIEEAADASRQAERKCWLTAASICSSSPL